MRSFFPIALSFLFAFTATVRADDLERSLQKEYEHKTVLLRGFYEDNEIQFDSQGQPKSKTKPGSWTTSWIEIRKLKIDKRQIQVTGWRHVWLNKKHSNTINIPMDLTQTDADFSATIDLPDYVESHAITTINKVFAPGSIDLLSIVPDFWKPFISGRIERKDGCSYVKDKYLRTDRGSSFVNFCLEPVTLPDGAYDPPYKVMGEVKRGAMISTPDPDYSEFARALMYQGKLELSVDVSETGEVKSVEIVEPLGGGLDEKAVLAVSQWKFTPATLHDEPIPVNLHVTVEFRLY